jgi:outer membrane protein OmpA-like peptidoglycan-associated protein
MFRILRISAAALFGTILFGPIASATDDQRFSIGAGFGLSTLNAGQPPWFTLGQELHIKADAHLKNNWRLEIGYSTYKAYDDATASGEFQLGSAEESRTRAWRGFDISGLVKYRWLPIGSRLGLTAGLGAGISNWRMANPGTGLTLATSDERGITTEFKTSEIFLASVFGIDYRFRDNWKAGIDLYSNYLTGVGREFDNVVEDSVGNWSFRVGLSLSYLFGNVKDKSRWDEIRTEFHDPPPGQKEPIIMDKSPEPVIVEDRYKDSDRDGVPDQMDNCPETPREAVGLIDIRGCPIDSDADGHPDYVDHCPRSPRGAVVDISGCPIDSDGDGVPDGLDDCPQTRPGLTVDRFGCVKLDNLNIPEVINIRYRPNSFEIDPFSRQKLDSIAMVLKEAPTVTVTIYGYADNTGSDADNRILSQKRANRVRDYLVSRGIESGRLNPVGRGASQFIASNKTETGRRQNRRVELVFSR